MFGLIVTLINSHWRKCPLDQIEKAQTDQWRSQGEASTPPRNPGKFAKDGEQPRPQPAIRIDSSRKL